MAVLKNESLKMDLQNLMFCIECHKEEKNTDVIIETLKTIVNICTKEEIGKDAFREVGGLDFLLQFIMDTDQIFILEYGLKVLAFVMDGNVHSQLHLTEDKIFRILQTIFEKKTYPLSVIKNAAVLFSTLLFQNRSAQDIIQENESLLSLMNLYKCFVPLHPYYSCSPEDSEHLDIWLAINSSLCFAVNNPLHEKNQETCSTLFPLSLRIIESTFNPTIIDATSSFLSLSIASNEKNQDAFAELDGFLILKHSLNKNFEDIQSCIKECNNVIKKGTLQILSSLISIISAAVLDHGKNASLCGKLGIILLMTKLLFTTALNSSATKKILLILGHCVDACIENRFIILEVPKLNIILKRNLETDDPELYSAARYLLQVCLCERNKENKPNQDFCSETDNFLESCQQTYKVLRQLGNSDFFKQNISYQPSNNDSVSEHSSSQEGVRKLNSERNPIKSKKKSRQKITDQGIPKCAESKILRNDNSASDSVEEISLHSAAHLYRLRQRNRKGIDQHGPESNHRENKLTNHCAVDEACYLNTDSEVNSSYSDTDCQKVKNYKSELEKCRHSSKILSRTSLSLPKRKNQRVGKSTVKKNKLQNLIHSSVLSENGKQSPNDSLKKNNNQNKSLSFEKVQLVNKVAQTVSAGLDKSAVFCKETRVENSKSNVHSPNKKSTTELQEALSGKACSFSLQSFPQPYSCKTKNEKSLMPKAGPSKQMHPSKTPGCMEVVVIPGATCSEHKLAAQFELLKVCPLKTSE